MSRVKFIDRTIEEQNRLKQIEFDVNDNKGAVTCKLHDSRTGRTFIGVTKARQGDEFNEKTGRNIAFCKARLQEIGHNKASLKSYLVNIHKLTKEANRQIQNKLKKLESDRNVIIQDLKQLSN